MIRQLKTRWSDQLGSLPLSQYPRPQFRRDSCFILNGKWECTFTFSDDLPETYDNTILVPFSPEALLSGVNHLLKPEERLWYRRHFSLPEDFNQGLVILNFEAVDQIAEVYLNGSLLGTNTGGYYPFSFDVTTLLREDNELIVKVRDYSDSSYFERGKQKMKRGGIWYTPQSGIWQTVWLESVPDYFLENIRITPDLNSKSVTFEFIKNNSLPVNGEITLNGQQITSFTAENSAITVTLDEVKPWSPEDPVLYNLRLQCGEDTVYSYFAFRKFEIKTARDGYKRFYLNGKAYYPNGLLDQGYWSDGLMTAPSDEAIIHDITICKERGFNTLRKHIKIESYRWYYWCDKLGMLVFQDMVNGGESYSNWTTLVSSVFTTSIDDTERNYRKFSRSNPEGRQMYYDGLRRMVDKLYNVPSIVLWTAFNEGWGQFDSKKAVEYLGSLDNTRIIEPVSGWHDQGDGEINSKHIYFRPVNMNRFNDSRLYFLSEFGGYTLKLYDHCFNDKQTFGYKKIKDIKDLNEKLKVLFKRDILDNIDKGLAASIYTQVSDVEDEVNGLMTYDRQITKMDKDTILDIVKEIEEKYKQF